MYLSITSRYLGPVFQCSCIPISSSKYKKDTFSLYVVMHFPFQLRSITSSCPSGAFFRYSHFWLLYGFRIGSDRHEAFFRYSHFWLLYGFWIGSDRIGMTPLLLRTEMRKSNAPAQRRISLWAGWDLPEGFGAWHLATQVAGAAVRTFGVSYSGSMRTLRF